MANRETVAETGPPVPFQLASDEFPIGMFSPEGQMVQCKKMGSDFVLSYHTRHTRDGGMGTEGDLTLLKKAQEYGLRVAFAIRGDAFVSMDEGIQDMLQVAKTCTSCRGHERTGRPLASAVFVGRLAKLLNRCLKPQKRGRKRACACVSARGQAEA